MDETCRRRWEDSLRHNIRWNLKGRRALQGKKGSIIRFLGLLWPDYAGLMHPRSQGSRVEAQERFGPAFPLDAHLGNSENSFSKGTSPS